MDVPWSNLVKTRFCPDFGLVTVVLWLLARYSVQLDQVPRGFPVVVESLMKIGWRSNSCRMLQRQVKALVLIGGVCPKDNSYSNAYLSLSPWSQLPYTWAIYIYITLGCFWVGWKCAKQCTLAICSLVHSFSSASGWFRLWLHEDAPESISAKSSSNSQLSAQNNEVASNPLLDVES